MYRSVVYLALISAIFCVIGIALPQSISSLTFLLPDGVDAFINLLLAVVLLHFGIASFFRQKNYKLAFGVFGASWLMLALIGLARPTYFGLMPHYMRAANIAMMIILSIGYLIAAAEYRRPSLAQELGLIRLKYIWRDALPGNEYASRNAGSAHGQ